MCDFGISRQPRGAALVIVMLVMAVLLMAGTTFLTISSTESQIALNEHGSARALVLAEAAIHKAIASLNDSVRGPAYLANNGEMNTMLGGGTFTLSFVVPSSLPASRRCPTDNSKDLIATASVPVRGGQAQAQLQVTVDKVSYPYRWAAFAVVANGIVARTWWCWSCNEIFDVDRTEKELWLDNNAAVDSFDSGAGLYHPTTNSGKRGNVGANGDVTIDYNSTIKGNVQAGDVFHPGPGVNGVEVSGSVTEGVSPNKDSPGEPFPSVSAPGSTTTDLNVTSGTRTLSAGTYIYRNVNFSDGTSLATSGSVRIYVTGTVTIHDGVTLGSPPGTQLQIITKSDGGSYDTSTFQTGHNFKLYGSLYGKNTDVKLGRDARVFGSIIGRTVYVGSRINIYDEEIGVHFDQAMSNQAVCHNDSNFRPNFTIRRGTWREIIPST